jgi:multidrug efflux pump
VAFDTTPFVKLSIEEVVKTLVEAIILVFLVMYLFLQNFRATLIPTMAVPVVLLGTFGILNAFGYSINTLTMFAMVLAIGLLVDDDRGGGKRRARDERRGLVAAGSDAQVHDADHGALVGIAMVLSAVFVPMAFFGGSTGVIYRQFSITIVSSMVLSVSCAVFTPACAPPAETGREGPPRHQQGFLRLVQPHLRQQQQQVPGLGWRHDHAPRPLDAAVRAVARWPGVHLHAPADLLPAGRRPGHAVYADSAADGRHAGAHPESDRTGRRPLHEQREDNVASVFAVAGFSFGGNGQNTGIAFVRLKDWALRKDVSQKAPAVAGRAMGKLSQIKDAMVLRLRRLPCWNWVTPPVSTAAAGYRRCRS